MRVMKPSSANNSPRSSSGMARRRTLMNDGNAQRRRQQVLDQLSVYYGAEQQSQPKPPRSRPVSWHPNTLSQQLQPQFQQSAYPITTPTMYAEQQDVYTGYQLSPMLTAHSCNTSPASVYSPLSLPFQTTDNMSCMPSDNSVLSQQAPTTIPAPKLMEETYSIPDENVTDTMVYANGVDWNAFIMQGFNSTTPPTPEAFPQAELSQLAVSEESIPYQALEDSEDEGEILVGMGLYDTPDKYEDDPQLNNYRSTVSSLLGSSFRRPEPCGKGLKLEETWEPPKSDEEEGEEDDEQDEDD